MGKIIECILPPGGILEEFFVKKILGGERLLEEFEDRTKNFIKSQEENLDRIIEENEGTRWGRDHKFSRLNHKNWSTMPIITYEQVRPYIDRIRKGDFCALTNEKPEALALTSGTDTEPKFIPLTQSSIKSQKRGVDVWNFRLGKEHIRNLNKLLVLSGSSRKKDNELLPLKSYTDIVREQQPSYVQKRMVFPKKVEDISDFEHRLLIAAQQSFIKQPTSLVSTNPITILRLLELTDENRAEIGRATIKEKYVGTNIDIGKIKDKEKILGNIFSKNPLDSVKFIGTWLGGTQYLFVKQLRKRDVKVAMRDLGYLATEGRFSIPIEDDTSAGILNLFGNYYEFMTLDKKDTIPFKELKKGEEYNIIITAENGLYRYDMQDVVRIDGWYNETPLISFRRKDVCFSSLIGEKLHENHVVDLLKKINAEGFLIAHPNPPHYVLNLPNKYQELSEEAVDKILQEINPEYFEKREGNRLKCLELRFLEENEFRELDKKINPNQEHDRFKRRYLVPLLA